MCYPKGSKSFSLLNLIWIDSTTVFQSIQWFRRSSGWFVLRPRHWCATTAFSLFVTPLKSTPNRSKPSSMATLWIAFSILTSFLLFFSFSLSEREGFTNAEDSLAVYLLRSQSNRADGASIPALSRASSALVVDSLCLERHFSKSGLHSQDLLLDRLRIQRSRRDRSTIVSGLLSRCWCDSRFWRS